jgi:deoxyribose-phosphate aldolase
MSDVRAAAARRALPLLDLTDLGEAADEAATDRLCARAARPDPARSTLHAAAVCLWPRFVARAEAQLKSAPVRIATVANFPRGADLASAVVALVEKALADGADEIDLVMNHRAFRAGRAGDAAAGIARVRAAVPATRLLKVILETGELGPPATIRAAARLAVAEGADMLKTSTGKAKVNATLASTRVLLEVARESGRAVGVKAAGGIRTTADAAAYLALADETMGAGWAAPSTFRFGASGLLDDLLAALGDAPAAAPRAGY